MGSVAQFPGSIVSIFIQVFNNKWELKEAWQEAWLDFQMNVLHVLGAMLCSSKVCHCQKKIKEGINGQSLFCDLNILGLPFLYMYKNVNSIMSEKAS